MAEFYSNENFPKRVVEELRRLGHDVLTSYEAGRANQRMNGVRRMNGVSVLGFTF